MNITNLGVIVATALVIGGPSMVMGQSGSPSPNVPKESGLPSKESDTHGKQGAKGLSGQESKNKQKDSIQQQKEQMERKQSGH